MDPALEIRIETARAGDAPVLASLIRGLAEYEKLADRCVVTAAALGDSLFGERPAAEAVLARAGAEAVGFALYFHTYSTFLARRGLYLEDLFVVPEWRGRGVGRRLLAHVAGVAVERGCGRLEWAVLDWNEPAIGFYRALGAALLDDWRIFRITGKPLERLAGRG